MKFLRALLFCLLLMFAASSLTWASVAATFNFDSDTPGTYTPFVDSNNGVLALFTSDNNGFYVGNPSIAPNVTFQGLTGNYLISNDGSYDTVFVVFSGVFYSASFNFAISDISGGFGAAFVGYAPGGVTGFNIAGTSIPAGYTFPEGTLHVGSFLGFNAIEIFSSSPDMAIDNLTLYTPEPSSLLMLGSGLLGIVGAFRRRLLM